MKDLLFILIFSQTTFAWTQLGTNIYGWDTKKLTLYVNASQCSVSSAAFFTALDSAINKWNALPNSNLEISRSTTPSTETAVSLSAYAAANVPLVVCDSQFGTNFTSVDPDGVPGFTISPRMSTDRHINYSGLILNSQSGTGADIAGLTAGELDIVLAHEIGHVLGLGHSSSSNALMYYSIANKAEAVISEDDQEGMAHLYPRNEFKNGQLGCAAVHSNASSLQEPFWFFFISLLLIGNIIIARKIRPEPLL